MKLEEIGSRISHLRKSLKLSRGDLARVAGVSEHAVGNWERGQTNLKGSSLIAVANLLKTTPTYILSGKQPQGVEEIAPSYQITPLHMEVRKVPLISSVQAGNWCEAVDNFAPGDAEEWIDTTAKVSTQAFALRVTGDSMTNPYGSPSIPEGAIVIVDPNLDATSGKIVVAKLTDSQEVTIKRLVIDGPNTYLKPLNPEYKTIPVNGNCTIVGVARKVEFDL